MTEYLESAEHNLSYLWDEVDPVVLAATDLDDPVAVAALFENIGLRQEVKISTILNISVTSYINLVQKAAPQTHYLSASNHIHLTQLAECVGPGEASSQLFITQSVTVEKTKPVESVLTITQVADADAVMSKSVTSALDLKSIASFHIVNLCEYSSGEAPVLTRRSTTRLTYPYVSPVTTLEIRNPDFDNVEQLEFRKINRRSRGGTLQIYRDSNWPESERLILTFSGLSQDNSKNLLNFMNDSLGKEIGLLDFESRQWHGIILTPSSAVSEDGKKGFSASFEFEGTKV